MNGDNEYGQEDFPLRDEVEDFSGKMRTFVITCHEAEIGFSLQANEEEAGGIGYQFRAFSETSPFNALGNLRQKMRRALSMRHLTGSPGNYHMLHDSLCGRITSDNNGGILLVIDGMPLSITELEMLLATHEGFSFRLQLKDALE